jgi:ribonuclease HII
MPWLIGIDEAGYGPNLGPFVMSATLFQVPDGQGHNLWKPLRPAVRKARHKADGRLLVDDSKQVYSPKIGIGVLERNLGPFFQLACEGCPNTLIEFGDKLLLTPKHEMDHELYLRWDQSLSAEGAPLARTALLRGVLEKNGVRLHRMQSRAVMPRRFNQVIRDTDNKATVPLHCASELVQAITQYCHGSESIHIVVDRLGGRWHYAERISDWFPGQPVQCLEETGLVSRYQVGENIVIEFVVEADGNSLPVALASMVSKYLREVFMKQFNAWFQEQQPGITPTAGYPVDSHRFWQDAEPTRTRLGLINEDWWRER